MTKSRVLTAGVARGLGILMMSVTLVSCAAGKSQSGATPGDYGITVVPPAQRVAAPSLQGESLSGEPLSLQDFNGKTVLINVWGSWCVPCREEVDDLRRARQELPRRDVGFLGINIRDDRSAALAFEESNGVTWPSFYDPGGTLLLGFRESLPAAAVPTTYVIDADGRVAARLLNKQTSTTFVDVVDEVRGGGDG